MELETPQREIQKITEKSISPWPAPERENPVFESTEIAYRAINVVQIDDDGVRKAAAHIRSKLASSSYTPRTWRTHPLHILPAEPYNAADSSTKLTLDWIFLISSLNFSFWSEKEGHPDRYGVEWLEGWSAEQRGSSKIWTGYWTLVASLNRALSTDSIPITEPQFYSSELLCPDSLIEHVFRAADQCSETVPLLTERIAVMREVGFVLCTSFGGSFQGFIDEFHRRHDGEGTALDLVHTIVESFPSFRDEVWYEGRRVYIWKRAQILVAEIWAAFYPPSPTDVHPIFPGESGPAIHRLSMFADYRVPQILHHLRILSYPPHLIRMLREGVPLPSGSKEEVSIRAASIVAVERVRKEITDQNLLEGGLGLQEVSSVLIDFYMWDLAKKVENGEETIEGMDTAEMVPIHRTRSIWY